MHHRVRALTLFVAVSAMAVAGCEGGSADEDRLDPGGESIIDENVDDGSVITDPGGVVNQLDGDDGDREDEGNINVQP